MSIERLTESLLSEFINTAYWLQRYNGLLTDGEPEEVKEALIQALVSFGPIPARIKELSDLLYPRMQNWS